MSNENRGTLIGSGRVRMPKRHQYEKVTTTQRNALTLGTVGEGTVVYDSTLKALVLWNGTGWTNLDGSALA